MTQTLAPLPARTARNANIGDLVSLLQAQDRAKLDIVVSLDTFRLNGGDAEVGGLDPILTEDGFYDVNGLYRLTDTADNQIASILDIPVKYLRKMRNEAVDLLDINVNEWAGRAENKKVLLRTLFGNDPAWPGSCGIVRAVLSDRYGCRDNLDTLLAVLDGLRAAGLSADNLTISGNLTDNRMSLFVEAPEIFVNAPELLGNYRAPTGLPRIQPGRHEFVNETIHAGIAISNSETGGGALSVVPRIVVLRCLNGLMMTKDAFRKVHLGARLDEGQIVWSNETRDAANELAKQQVKDAVQAFLNVDYVQAKVNEITETAQTPLVSPTKTIEVVAQKMAYRQEEADGILSHFIQGGQVTAGGVLQAVTSWSQMVQDPDRAFDLEAGAMQAMELAAVNSSVH